MVITLSLETETRLRERAEHDGQDAHALADSILSHALADDPDDLTEEEVADIRMGIRRGMEAAEAGRVTLLSQAIAGVRLRREARHLSFQT